MNDNNTNMVAEEKAALLEKVQGMLGNFVSDLQSMKPEHEELLRQSQAKEEEVVEIFNSQLRRLEEERVQLDQKIQDFEGQISTALKEKETAEASARAALDEAQKVQDSLKTTLEEKVEAERGIEAALQGKAEAETAAKQALAQKAEIEKRVEALSRVEAEAEAKISGLTNELATMGDSLRKAAALTEAAVNEKAAVEEKLEAAIREKKELQDKLDRFKEKWEIYITSKQG